MTTVTTDEGLNRQLTDRHSTRSGTLQFIGDHSAAYCGRIWLAKRLESTLCYWFLRTVKLWVLAEDLCCCTQDHSGNKRCTSFLMNAEARANCILVHTYVTECRHYLVSVFCCACLRCENGRLYPCLWCKTLWLPLLHFIVFLALITLFAAPCLQTPLSLGKSSILLMLFCTLYYLSFTLFHEEHNGTYISLWYVKIITVYQNNEI